MTKYLVGDIGLGGFGALYSRRKLIMQIAEAFQRTPIFRYTNYVYDDPFEPLSFTLQDLKKLNINEIKKFTFQEEKDIAMYFDFESYYASSFRDIYQNWHPKDESYLLYSGKLYSNLKLNVKYTTEVNNLIKTLMNLWGINSFKDIIGLHMRKGDRIVESPYLSEEFAINFIKEHFDISKYKVFVTSDEEESILSLIKKYPEIDFIYDSNEKRYGRKDLSNMQLVINNPSLKFTETLTFVKNVEILKQCHCVIGSCNVQLTKISGSINSYLNNKNNLYLINPTTNKLEELGTSLETS